MMELESELLTATNEKSIVMILDQHAEMLMLANPSRSCGSVDSIIRTNDLTHFSPSSVFIHGATWDSRQRTVLRRNGTRWTTVIIVHHVLLGIRMYTIWGAHFRHNSRAIVRTLGSYMSTNCLPILLY